MYGFINRDGIIFDGRKTKKKFLKLCYRRLKQYSETFKKNLSLQDFLELDNREIVQYSTKRINAKEIK